MQQPPLADGPIKTFAIIAKVKIKNISPQLDPTPVTPLIPVISGHNVITVVASLQICCQLLLKTAQIQN